MAKRCTHGDQIREVTPSADGCEDCLRIGDSWVHLRLCMTCGHVGCCDDSKNKHATAHFRRTGHPIMRSFEPGEDWAWCYVDNVALDPRGWPSAALSPTASEPVGRSRFRDRHPRCAWRVSRNAHRGNRLH